MGISPTATQAEIKKAYHQLVLRWHPDRHQSSESKKLAEERFKEITIAYSIIGDEKKRREYDASVGISPSSFQSSHRDSNSHASSHSPFGTPHPNFNMFAWADAASGVSDCPFGAYYDAGLGFDPMYHSDGLGGIPFFAATPFAEFPDGPGEPFGHDGQTLHHHTGPSRGQRHTRPGLNVRTGPSRAPTPTWPSGLPYPGTPEFDVWMAECGAAGQDPFAFFMSEVFGSDPRRPHTGHRPHTDTEVEYGLYTDTAAEAPGHDWGGTFPGYGPHSRGASHGPRDAVGSGGHKRGDGWCGDSVRERVVRQSRAYRDADAERKAYRDATARTYYGRDGPAFDRFHTPTQSARRATHTDTDPSGDPEFASGFLRRGPHDSTPEGPEGEGPQSPPPRSPRRFSPHTPPWIHTRRRNHRRPGPVFLEFDPAGNPRVVVLGPRMSPRTQPRHSNDSLKDIWDQMHHDTPPDRKPRGGRGPSRTPHTSTHTDGSSRDTHTPRGGRPPPPSSSLSGSPPHADSDPFQWLGTDADTQSPADPRAGPAEGVEPIQDTDTQPPHTPRGGGKGPTRRHPNSTQNRVETPTGTYELPHDDNSNPPWDEGGLWAHPGAPGAAGLVSGSPKRPNMRNSGRRFRHFNGRDPTYLSDTIGLSERPPHRWREEEGGCPRAMRSRKRYGWAPDGSEIRSPRLPQSPSPRFRSNPVHNPNRLW